MGRPKLYHTEDDRLKAKRSYSKTYYAKNRERISLKNKVKYRMRVMRQHAGNVAPEALKPSLPETSRAQHSRYSFTSKGHVTAQSLEDNLMNIVQESSTGFLDELAIGIFDPAIRAVSIETIRQSLNRVEELDVQARNLHAHVLQADGVGSKLRQVEVTKRRISQVIYAMEDMLLHTGAADNADGFVDMYRRRQFVYQTGPDITPLP